MTRERKGLDAASWMKSSCSAFDGGPFLAHRSTLSPSTTLFRSPADQVVGATQGVAVTPIDVTTTDPDFDALTYTVQGGALPAELVLKRLDSITGKPAYNVVCSKMKVRATDADGAFVVYDVTVNV